jgi:glycosyltransferase 2 family protein
VKHPWMKIARFVFCFAGAIFLVLAFTRTWHDMRGHLLPSALSLSAGGAMILVALGCSTAGWATLFERVELGRALAYSFVLSQLGKYIPGGVWQVAGQIGLASDAGVTFARASSAVPVHVVVQVAAGGTVGALAGALPRSVPLVWRLVALASAAAVVLLNRGLMLAATTAVSRLGMGRLIGADIPSQGAIWRSYFWTSAGLLASGTAFAVMLSSVDRASPRPASAVVFALAWLAGFLAVPVPAGLGVREAVMMAFLPASAGAIVAVSLCHRILTMAAEWAAIAVARAYLR